MRNFFERQDEARRNTKKLIGLFVVAVIAIIVGVYAAVVGIMAWQGGTFDPVRPGLAFVVVVGTLGLVGIGSAVKSASLRRGGHVVAENLGGTKLDREPDSLEEQRLLNVVEEMAIASGVPVPPVYVLDEDGINAFAAGYTTDDAVIGVTRGCVELLSREELQGVIAHEFSHILNGDMRINIRLMGLLHGILLIGITGRLFMRTIFFSGGRRSRDSKGKIPLFLLGLALLVIGSIGFLCGRLIKAAVSRQREFLADAAAVQFTRNPDGIGGALKKIGGHVQGAKVEADKAEEASHLFFGYALGQGLLSSGAFSTHPPLEERIQRIDPSFDGSFPMVELDATSPSAEAGVAGLQGGGTESTRKPSVSNPEQVIEQSGQVTADQLAMGMQIREEVSSTLRQAVHEPLGAVAVVFGLLLDRENSMREKQLSHLRERLGKGVVEETQRLYSEVSGMERLLRLPLVAMAAPALRDLSDSQRTRFRETVREIARMDEQLTIFEYALETIVRHRLEHVAHPTEEQAQIRDVADVSDEIAVLLSGLAQAGHQKTRVARRAFQEGTEELSVRRDLGALDPVPARPRELDEALDQLARTTPQLKKDIIAACARCALEDEVLEPAETELLRAIAIALDVPLPPLLADQKAPAASADDVVS